MKGYYKFVILLLYGKFPTYPQNTHTKKKEVGKGKKNHIFFNYFLPEHYFLPLFL